MRVGNKAVSDDGGHGLKNTTDKGTQPVAGRSVRLTSAPIAAGSVSQWNGRPAREKPQRNAMQAREEGGKRRPRPSPRAQPDLNATMTRATAQAVCVIRKFWRPI